MSLAPPDWIAQWSEVVSGLGSIILSFLLVILYKRQQEQLAADNKALLDVSSVEWDGDEATIELSNFGNGVAADLSLVTLVFVDNGKHREYSSRAHHLKRQDKSGKWANTIRPEEEDIEFKGKSRIGKIGPNSWPDRWFPTNFSSFIREMRTFDSEEIKYIHVVKGFELSNDVCLTTVIPNVRALNPQNFGQVHSLENLPGIRENGSDNTFYPYFQSQNHVPITSKIYYRSVRYMNKIPKVSIQTRGLDASGLKLVKRVFLRRRIEKSAKKILPSLLLPP